MCDLTSRVFENLEIPYTMDVYQRVVYTQIILRGGAIKKYKGVLLECNKLAKDIVGYKWSLGDMKGISTEYLWTWAKSDGVGYHTDVKIGRASV